MREQLIVWRNDFENIEFRPSTPDDERIVSEEVIICIQHGSKSVGLFCKRNDTRKNTRKDTLYFEAKSGMRLTLDRIREFAFLE